MFVSRMDAPEVRTALAPALIPMLMVGIVCMEGVNERLFCHVLPILSAGVGAFDCW
jgi:Na+/citrate or Na+/malate symporter